MKYYSTTPKLCLLLTLLLIFTHWHTYYFLLVCMGGEEGVSISVSNCFIIFLFSFGVSMFLSISLNMFLLHSTSFDPYPLLWLFFLYHLICLSSNTSPILSISFFSSLVILFYVQSVLFIPCATLHSIHWDSDIVTIILLLSSLSYAVFRRHLLT